MKQTKKINHELWEIQTNEKYRIFETSNNSFEIFTKDLEFKAFVTETDVSIYARDYKNYDKTDFDTLNKFCHLLQKQKYEL